MTRLPLEKGTDQKNSRRLELSILKTPRTEGGDEVPGVWTQGSRQVGFSR